MADHQGKYNIKAISTMLGIHPGTLRAWERRYKLIEPIRNDAGHRLYTDDQLNVLKWIVNKVNHGFTIGQAVELLDKQDVIETVNDETVNNNQMDNIKEDILHSLLKFEERKANELLDYAFNVFSIEKVVIHILGSILIEVGDKWEKNEITIAHEHFSTSFLRTRIGMVFQHLPVNGLLPKVVTVCGPNEQHEIGLLIFNFYLRRRGYETVYLGAGIPGDDVIDAVREINPRMVIISCTLTEHLSDTLKLTDGLKEFFPDLVVGLGGEALKNIPQSSKKFYESFLVGENEEEWMKWLKNRL
ncbi:MerR family transcriptional regulator [Salipaludibacillus aurantiacus]|uniref:Methanogenic corrinoid protein MtbC1 n=1 Tax=Salipaludibacillus aurantiacus TaxID=1601833 RepID=A0A1H9PAP9_9BACI|nr:MerR family transcriptional regulator [Salipaludibacillus aurantiacus]SER45217.1 Methanogenic corrinoid protein MtbC1 [Salipaludibacillus aurantiacus]